MIKILFIIAVVLAVFIAYGFSSKSIAQIQAKKSNPEAYMALRNLVLSLDSKKLKRAQDKPTADPIAILMDEHPTGKDFTYSLTAICDGGTSLYLSTGGGFIGAGEHPAPKAAALELLEFAKNYKTFSHITTETPLPKDGQVTFYFVSDAGIYTATADTAGLQSGKDPLFPLYTKAQNVLTLIRLQFQGKAKK